MDSNEKIDLMWRRFVHRPDTYGLQRYEPKKGTSFRRIIKGSCPLRPPCPLYSCSHVESMPLSKDLVRQHLVGSITLGIYQLDQESTVKWLCFDVDLKRGEEDTEAKRLVIRRITKKVARAVFDLCGANSFLVEESGSKGYHVWVFFSESVTANMAYTIGYHITSAIKLPDYIVIEVFPKQRVITLFGNLVKLPLGIHKKTNMRCFFVTNAFEPHENQWEVLANVRTFSTEDLRALIEQHDIHEMQIETRGDDEEINSPCALPCTTRMMREGFPEGTRDIGNFVLAAWLRKRGVPSYAVETVLHTVNERSTPPLHPETIHQKVNRVFEQPYPDLPCMHAQLDSFCSSECRFFEGKRQRRWPANKPADDAIGVISRD